MKFWKVLGGILVFLGCFAALAGVLATAAPIIENDHVQRIIASFSVKSLEPFINMLNGLILFCLNNNYLVFGTGAGVMLVGGLLKTMAAKALYRREDTADAPRADTRSKKRRAPKMEAYNQPRDVTIPAPTPRNTAKEAAGLSPYAAAAYGKALSSARDGEGKSEIAAKYMPKSIIDTPLSDGDAYARTATNETDRVASYQGASQNDPNAETIICRACGTPNPEGMLFCDNCGSRLYDLRSPVGMREQGALATEREPKPAYVPGDYRAAESATVSAWPSEKEAAEPINPRQPRGRESLAPNNASALAMQQAAAPIPTDYSQSFVPAIVSIDPRIAQTSHQTAYMATDHHATSPQERNRQAMEVENATNGQPYASDFVNRADEPSYGSQMRTRTVAMQAQDALFASDTLPATPLRGEGTPSIYGDPQASRAYKFEAQPTPIQQAGYNSYPQADPYTQAAPNPAQPAQSIPPALPQGQAPIKPRPRIISTMGKKSTR